MRSLQDRSQTLDKTVFEALFRSEFKRLCFLSLQFVKDLDTSKEIVQDAFINLWEKRETIDLSKPVTAYLSTTVRNRSLNYLRDNKKFNNDLLTAEELLSDQGVYQENTMETTDISARIKEAIGELPEKCREIFILSRYENMKYQEIAGKLEISVKTVETQMSKALQHMRLRLKEFLLIVILLLIK
jgi:RNA polymerase sigma-70 factor, ECF subfamily